MQPQSGAARFRRAHQLRLFHLCLASVQSPTLRNVAYVVTSRFRTEFGLSPNLYEFLQLSVLGLIVPVTIYTDLLEGKILNVLTIPSAIVGLLLAFLYGGAELLNKHFWAMLLGMGIFMIPYFISGFSSGGRGKPVVGAGDSKLAGAVGAVWGIGLVLQVVEAAIFSGAVIGIMMIAVQVWKNRQADKASTPEKKISIWKMRIPFGTAICFGIILTFTNNYLLQSGA